MSEVSVNIRGRDDGLGKQLDSLRQKAADLGREVANLNEMTPTERKVSLGNTSQDVLRGQQDIVRQEYSDLRSANQSDYDETRSNFESGGMGKDDWAKYQSQFTADQQGLNDQESAELLSLEREANAHLRDILAELSTQDKIERERRQRDNKEFSEGGDIGKLLSENRALRQEQSGSNSDDRIAEIQSRIDANNDTISDLRRPNPNSDMGFGDLGMAAGAAGSGDAMGAVGGGLRGMGKMTGMVKGFTIAGIVAMIVKETLGFGDKLRESLAPVSSLRGGYGTGSNMNDAMRAQFEVGGSGRFDFGAIGMDNTEVAAAMMQKAQASGVAGDDLQKRTFDDVAFQKAFGADAGMFSEFERFTKGQEDATEIAMDVLNVLSSIEGSSLKETDLSTLTEKLSAQQTILGLQRQRRDVVDNDGALKILSAFESIGLSKKGGKSGDFLSQTIQGLGEGGSDNAMMLKLEAARRSRPDLANNPAALRRLVKFNSDNPEYMSEFFNMAGTMTGGDDMAMDDMLMTFFNPQSEEDLEIYKKAMKSGDFQSMLKGGNLNRMKTRKSTLNESTMVSDAESGVGQITETLKDFSNQAQNAVDVLSSALKSLVTGNAVNVSILEDKSKKKTKGTINQNVVKSGE